MPSEQAKSSRSGTMSRHVRLRDVADAAGVSLATASKALNGKGHVHPETRARVEEAAHSLGFAPNSLVRTLIDGRSNTVGLITNDLDGRFSVPLLMAVEDTFALGRMQVFLCDARDDPLREQYHLDSPP